MCLSISPLLTPPRFHGMKKRSPCAYRTSQLVSPIAGTTLSRGEFGRGVALAGDTETLEAPVTGYGQGWFSTSKRPFVPFAYSEGVMDSKYFLIFDRWLRPEAFVSFHFLSS
jgi:hypothetical protein